MRKLMLTTPVDEKIAFVGVDRIMQTLAFRLGRTFLMRSNRSSMLVWKPLSSGSANRRAVVRLLHRTPGPGVAKAITVRKSWRSSTGPS